MTARKPPTVFKPGQSGNPRGRPPGRPDKRTILRELVRPHAPELVEKALELARAGDAAAIRLLLDRAIPPLKPAAEAVTFPMPADASNLAAVGRAVVAAIAEARLPPDVGRSLLDSLAALAGLVEHEDVLRRLEALEAATKTGDAR